VLNLPQGKSHRTPPEHALAGRLTVATLSILLLGGVLNRSASAQVVSMHTAVKRAVPQAQTTLERATSEASTINSAQGPGGSAIGPGTRVQFVSGARVHRHDSSSIVLWTASFRYQSQLGWARAIAEHRPG
jgi:hypothetical protein